MVLTGVSIPAPLNETSPIISKICEVILESSPIESSHFSDLEDPVVAWAVSFQSSKSWSNAAISTINKSQFSVSPIRSAIFLTRSIWNQSCPLPSFLNSDSIKCPVFCMISVVFISFQIYIIYGLVRNISPNLFYNFIMWLQHQSNIFVPTMFRSSFSNRLESETRQTDKTLTK